MSRSPSSTAWPRTSAASSDVHPVAIQVPSGADRLTAGQLLDRVDTAICALNGAESLAWVQAYCDNVADRGPLVERIALAASKLGNDPHNQEIAQCMLMDFAINRHPARDKLLLAAAYHTAMHRKYGDPLELCPAVRRRAGVSPNCDKALAKGGRCAQGVSGMAIDIRAIDPAVRPFFAGEVSGVDLSRDLAREDVAAISAAMDHYGVLVFHDQRLDEPAARVQPQLRRAGAGDRGHRAGRGTRG